MSNRRRTTGFSLLELTLAMTIAAMLAVTLYTAMAAAVKARRSINNAIEPTRAVNIAGEMLTEDFKNVPQLHLGGLADSFEGVHQTGLPGGDNDTVQFYTIGSDATGSANDDTSPLLEGIRRVELAVKTDVNPPVLVRRVTRNLLAPTLPLPEEEILCTGVRPSLCDTSTEASGRPTGIRLSSATSCRSPSRSCSISTTRMLNPAARQVRRPPSATPKRSSRCPAASSQRREVGDE